MFSCRTCGFCPSCHAKRLEEWGEWMRETLLLDVPHRQVVFTIPRMLRIFFRYNRRLLGELCRSALRSLIRYFAAVTGSELMPGVIVAIQTFGTKINFHPHLHFPVTEGGMDEAGIFHVGADGLPRVHRPRYLALGGDVRPFLGAFWLVRALSTGFQLNLTSANTSIYHCQRWDEAKLNLERSFGRRSTKRMLPIFYTDYTGLYPDPYFIQEPFSPRTSGRCRRPAPE
jgi:hypothetical protein